jgi:CO/xanthine dehydrogenase FAD-binding subunit
LPIFHPNEYLRPSTPEEVTRLLDSHGDGALIIGGGTEIYELAERGLLSETSALLDLSGLKLDRIEQKGRSLEIGASVKLSELEEHDAMKRPSLGAVSDSLRSIHPVQVKNLATVGGAVCSSISFFDLPVGLATLDAMVDVFGGAARKQPVAEFMVDFLTPDLKSGEFVTGVTVEPDVCTTSAFSKFCLTGNDWAIVNCGCSLRVESGEIASARVVFGGVSSRLVVAREAPGALRGLSAEPGEQFEGAIERLDGELKDVVSDYRASAEYRKKLAGVLMRETLNKALTRERG